MIGEYTRYIEPILRAYRAKKSVYDYLVQLHTDLIDAPNEIRKNDIKWATEKIIIVLKKYNFT